MALEDDLKQSHFDNEYQKAMVNILFTGSWLSAINSSKLKKFGISPEQFNVLRILRGSHPTPLRLADITNRMIDKSSNCTRLVEKLRLKKLVKREVSASNRREVEISIEPTGLKLLATIDKEYQDWIRQLQTITKSEAKELNRILDKLRG